MGDELLHEPYEVEIQVDPEVGVEADETFEIKLNVIVTSKIGHYYESSLISVLEEKKTIEVVVEISSPDIPIFLGEKRVDKAKLALIGDISRGSSGYYYLYYQNNLTLHAKAPSSLGVYYITFFVKKET